MYATISHAICTALTPLGVSDECASKPRTRQRQAFLPLCATTSSMPVGSPTMHAAGRTPRATMSAISRRTPMQPTSSSYDSAKCSGFADAAANELGHERETACGEALHVGHAASVEPAVARGDDERIRRPRAGRPPARRRCGPKARCRLSSRCRRTAASVAKRFALRRSSSKVSVDGEAVSFEVVAYPVDEREVGIAARRVVADQRADEIERARCAREVTWARFPGAFMTDLQALKEEHSTDRRSQRNRR